MERFVSSNPWDATSPSDAFASSIYGGPHGVIAQLEVLRDGYATDLKPVMCSLLQRLLV